MADHPPALNASDLALLNAALAHLGEEPLSALAVDPAPAPRPQRLYTALVGPLLDGLLRDHNWSCATRRQILLSTDSGGDWRYARFCALPDDTLRLWSVEDTAAWEAGFKGAQRGVFTNSEAAGLPVVLTVRTPVKQLDAALFDVLALLLAARMAGPMQADTALAEKLHAAAQDAATAAVSAEVPEWGAQPSDNTDLLRAAMGHLGEEAPQDVLTGPSMKAKRAYRALVGPLLDGVLSSRDWACATSHAVLPAEAPPAGEWRYTSAHTLPNDTLKVRSVETALAWQVGRNGDRKVVLCSTGAALQATLTRRVPVTGLDPVLFNAVALLLAAQMAGALGAGKERMEALQQASDAAMGAAAAAEDEEWSGEAAGADLLRAALGHLGEAAGGDTFGGPSGRARRAFAAVVGPVTDSILRGHPWACATVRVVLAPQATADWRYGSAHAVPEGVLRVWSVETWLRWEVGRQGAKEVVFCNCASALNAVVIRRVPPEQMDATLFDAVALAVAVRMAVPLKASAALTRQLREQAMAALELAMGAETSEWGNEPEPFVSTWLAARGDAVGWGATSAGSVRRPALAQLGLGQPSRFRPSVAGSTVGLPFTVPAGASLDLAVNGVLQTPDLDYVVDQSNVTFLGDGVTPDDEITAALRLASSGENGAALAAPADLAARVDGSALSVRYSPPVAGPTLPLPFTLADDEALELDVNGVRQWEGLDYALSAGVVTFLGGGIAPADVVTLRRSDRRARPAAMAAAAPGAPLDADFAELGYSVPVRFQPVAAGATLILPFDLAPGEQLELALNGVRQWNGLDYVAASKSSIRFLGGGVTPADVLTARRLILSTVGATA